MTATAAVPLPGRVALVDILRGVAILAMAFYHFSWDLTFFGLAQFELLGDPGWLALRAIIPSVFLALVGVSLVLGPGRGLRPKPFLRRLTWLVICALLVTAVTRFGIPDNFIFFGVLHSIAVGSVLGLVALRLPVAIVALLAALVVAAPWLIASPRFDQPWLLWVGLGTIAPHSNDYVPLFPWFGLLLAGIVLGRLAVAYGGAVLAWRPTDLASLSLAWLGRHALLLYMVHQPLLIAGLFLAVITAGGATPFDGMLGRSPAAPAHVDAFLAECTETCSRQGGTVAQCQRYCRCTVIELVAADLWESYLEAAAAGTLIDPARPILDACETAARGP